MKSELLRVSDTLLLPIDAVTQKLAWLGRTGSGKTYGCKRMVEQMLRAGAQVVILDGAGGWPGLRLGPKSFDIPVLGGLYGDIPLEPTAGALIADIIVDSETSIVLDVSQMIDADRNRFATSFAQRFFQRKKASPGAVHLVLEECQDYVPQNFQSGEERMLHEFQRIAKQGRPHGIGLSLISQRPQEISKKALNQTECVFAFQMTGPQERKALEYWLSDKGFDGKLSNILPTLEVGAPHVWSPQWLKISKVVRILPIDSLDTSSTPKVGEKAFKQKKLTPIDLKSLTAAMAETVERAKAEDPKELKKQIQDLKKELGIAILDADRSKRTAASKPVEIPIELDYRSLAKRLEATFEAEVRGLRMNLPGILSRWAEEATRVALKDSVTKKKAKASASTVMVDTVNRNGNGARPTGNSSAAKPFSSIQQAASASRDPAVGNGGLLRMMIALAQRPQGLSRSSLGLRSGLSSSSGTFSNYLSQGRTAGWLEGKSEVRVTDAGIAALGHYDPLPEGAELLNYWIREIGENSGAARMLLALANQYPDSLSRAELGAESNLDSNSGTFSNYLSKLRGLELIEGKSELRLSEELAK